MFLYSLSILIFLSYSEAWDLQKIKWDLVFGPENASFPDFQYFNANINFTLHCDSYGCDRDLPFSVNNLTLNYCKAYKDGYLINIYDTDIKEDLWSIKFGSNFRKEEKLLLEFKYTGHIGHDGGSGLNLIENFGDDVKSPYLSTNTSTKQQIASLLPALNGKKEFLLAMSVNVNTTVIANGKTEDNSGHSIQKTFEEVKLNRIEDMIMIIGPFLQARYATRYENTITSYIQPEVEYNGDKTEEFLEMIWSVIQGTFGKAEYDITVVRLVDLRIPRWHGNILTLDYQSSTLTPFLSTKSQLLMKIDITSHMLRQIFGEKIKPFDQKADNLLLGISRYVAIKLFEDTMDTEMDKMLINEIGSQMIHKDTPEKIKEMLNTLEMLFGKETMLTAAITFYNDNNGKSVYDERFSYSLEKVLRGSPVCGRTSVVDMITSWLTNIDIPTKVTLDSDFKLKQTPVSYSNQKILPVFYIDDYGKKGVFYLLKFDSLCFPSSKIDLKDKIIFSPAPHIYQLTYHNDVSSFYLEYGLNRWSDEMVYNVLLNYTENYDEANMESVMSSVISTRDVSRNSIKLIELLSEMRRNTKFSPNLNNIYRNLVYGYTQLLHENYKGSTLRERYLKSVIGMEALNVGIKEEKSNYLLQYNGYGVQWKKDFEKFLDSVNPDDLTAIVCSSVINLNFQGYSNWVEVKERLSKSRPSVVYHPLVTSIENGLNCLRIM